MAGYWTFFAEEAMRGGSSLYAALSRYVETDDDLLAMAGEVQPGQPLANILLGAVHFMLLRGLDDPLADHYPSVRPHAQPQGDAGPLFRAFCLKHRDALLSIIRTRVTNTNEVRRSTALFPAFHAIGARSQAPLHLVELGPSAGFNLNWDRYAYVYERGDTAPLIRYPAGQDAAMTLRATLKSAHSLPLQDQTPLVASRMGIERNPVNLQSADDRDWLKALVWPELGDRHERLDLAIRALNEDPPRIWAGDAIALLPVALAHEFPKGAPVTVFHTHVTYQFSDDMRVQLHESLRAASQTRVIWRLSIEYDGAGYPVMLGKYDAGTVSTETLARCDPHGTWLDWQGA